MLSCWQKIRSTLMFAPLCWAAALPASACCPAPASNHAVVNADQTVILIWDPATKTEHFIRQASFKTDAADFGFLVPTPNEPELEESSNEAFPFLSQLTAPPVIHAKSTDHMGCGCGMPEGAIKGVTVLQEKRVAGFQAAVLEAGSSAALVEWLKDHGYSYSPEIEAWAAPYIEKKWKITAMKVAKAVDGDSSSKSVNASALRMSFKTDHPLFPYREPDSRTAAEVLKPAPRLLRIYFVSDSRYDGELTQTEPWTGKVAWAGEISSTNRSQLLDLLKLPQTTGPATWWLTEFEDPWPYRKAPADVYFSRAVDQKKVTRDARSYAAASSADATPYLIGILVLVQFGKKMVKRSIRK